MAQFGIKNLKETIVFILIIWCNAILALWLLILSTLVVSSTPSADQALGMPVDLVALFVGLVVVARSRNEVSATLEIPQGSRSVLISLGFWHLNPEMPGSKYYLDAVKVRFGDIYNPQG